MPPFCRLIVKLRVASLATVFIIANYLAKCNSFYEKSQRFFGEPVENSLTVKYIAIFFIKSNDNTF